MAAGRLVVSMLGIVDLGDVCASMRARSLDLFEITGAWVSDAADARQQRWFAEASRRHGWHAELWAERSPAIPPVDADALVEEHRQAPVLVDTDDYRRRLDEMLELLDDVQERTVAELDPPTMRAIALTRADLVELRAG